MFYHSLHTKRPTPNMLMYASVPVTAQVGLQLSMRRKMVMLRIMPEMALVLALVTARLALLQDHNYWESICPLLELASTRVEECTCVRAKKLKCQ